MVSGLIRVDTRITSKLNSKIQNRDEFFLLTCEKFPYNDRMDNNLPLPMLAFTSGDKAQTRLHEGIVTVADARYLVPPGRFGLVTYGPDARFIHLPQFADVHFPSLDAVGILDLTKYDEVIIGEDAVPKKFANMTGPYRVYHGCLKEGFALWRARMLADTGGN